MNSRENYALFKYKIRLSLTIEEGNDIFTLTVEGLMSSFRASTGGHGGQQGGRGCGRGRGRGGHEGATLLNLKISHKYNILDAKSIDIISQNAKQNCRMNKMSKQTLPR
ncbi:hypothetical protein AAG906_012550 [Vitis piasezkii]